MDTEEVENNKISFDPREESKVNSKTKNIPLEDITLALSKRIGSSHFLILRHKLKPLTEKLGLLGEHSFLEVVFLNIEGYEETASFFVKYLPRQESSAKFAEGIGAFKKEMFIYKILETFKDAGVDLISAIAPRCYFSKLNEYLILDNLIKEGYETFSKHRTLEYDTVLVVLQSLARLHASSIIYEENQGSNLLDQYPEDFEESFFNDKEDFINAKGVEVSIDCVVKEIDIFGFSTTLKSGKNFSQIAEDTCYKIYELVKPSKKYRNVVSHGDIWATNLLLKRDLKTNKFIGCKFIDFQCGRYVPPSQDVLSFLYLTTSREFRKLYLYEVIGMYYSYLEKHLKMSGVDIQNVLPFADFMNSCEEQKLFAIIQTAIYFPLILINNSVVENYLTEKLFEDRSYLVLNYMDRDESYKERLIESIQDLKDYCDYL